MYYLDQIKKLKNKKAVTVNEDDYGRMITTYHNGNRSVEFNEAGEVVAFNSTDKYHRDHWTLKLDPTAKNVQDYGVAVDNVFTYYNDIDAHRAFVNDILKPLRNV